MIIILAPTKGSNEWNPSLDTFCIRMERLLLHHSAITDQEIANVVYNEGLEVGPLSAIAQIREALKADDHPPCGFSEDENWLAWAAKHGIEGVVAASS